MELKENSLCYMVTYLDQELCLPVIATLIYVGKNLSTDDDEDTWYFQDPQSFARGDSFLVHPFPDQQIFSMKAGEVTSVYDLEGLLAEISRIASGHRRI